MSDESFSPLDPTLSTAPGAIRVDPPDPEPSPDHEGHGDDAAEPSLAEGPALGSRVIYRSGPETQWPATVLGAVAVPGGSHLLDLDVHARTGDIKVQGASFSEEAVAGTWFHGEPA